MSEIRYEAFQIVSVDGTHMLGKTVDGKIREFEISISRDLVTNELVFTPVRHFVDPESLPWFPGSEPWEASEMLGNG